MYSYIDKIEDLRTKNNKIESDNKFYEDYYEVLVENISYNSEKMMEE